MDPVLRREIIECQQFVSAFGQAGHSLLKFDAVFLFEQIDCHQGFGACFRMLDVVQIGLHRRRHQLWKMVQHILDFMDPAALMFGAGENLVQGFPEAHGTVHCLTVVCLQAMRGADGNLRGGGQAAVLDIYQ